MTGHNTEAMIQVGGNEWRAGDNHRIYFNDLAGLYGLSTVRYKSGNISSATLDGEKISNSRANKIEYALVGAKIWFDVNSGTYQSSNIDADVAEKIIARIKEATR